VRRGPFGSKGPDHGPSSARIQPMSTVTKEFHMTTTDAMSISQTLVRASGLLARFCDRAEHNEGADRLVIIEVGSLLRATAIRALQVQGQGPIAAYASRIAEIESRHPLANAGQFDIEVALEHAKTWRELQQAQYMHDATYQPDVNGLAKVEQLQHYTLHIAKLAWIFQSFALGEDQFSEDEIEERRTPDILAFGLKLSTVCGELLPEELVETG
jgi:hypothetical protein